VTYDEIERFLNGFLSRPLPADELEELAELVQYHQLDAATLAAMPLLEEEPVVAPVLEDAP